MTGKRSVDNADAPDRSADGSDPEITHSSHNGSFLKTQADGTQVLSSYLEGDEALVTSDRENTAEETAGNESAKAAEGKGDE